MVASVSSANPKIADYEFTTLSPHLGVVDFSSNKSFVIADIPGLISGASDGIGLGIQFLKHLSRTRVILQMVDISEKDKIQVVKEVETLVQEVNKFDTGLLRGVRWLVFNKIDLINERKLQTLKKELASIFKGETKLFFISAKRRISTKELMLEIGYYLESYNAEE